MGILGIDLGGTNLRIGKIENLQLKKVMASPIKTNGTESEILNDIFRLIDQIIDSNISGIGIGVPSVVDIEKGIVYDFINIPSWKEVHLKKILEERYKIPVYINNDANCFAVGEKYFGKAKNYKNVVGLIIGTGLGAGIIFDEKLYSGTNCGAGEFGMIPYKDSVLENYCSGQFFKNKYNISGEELLTKAKVEEENALKIFSEFGSHLGNAIKIILYSVDPEVIILGGSVSKSFEFFKDKMWEVVNTFAYSQSLKNLKIEVSELDQVAILGAAALYYNATILND